MGGEAVFVNRFVIKPVIKFYKSIPWWMMRFCNVLETQHLTKSIHF
ncbi:MAG: hypothetical protein M2R45_03296 [Verrucomicrobia subdivision 3 bacterium]|nr:hypothetical protein [Limisphaerales bacterium]MCS1415427.1 hypothetical protein [Limisphaerales bacterium]